MTHRRRVRRLRVLTLLLALAALGVILLRMWGVFGREPALVDAGSPIAPTASPEPATRSQRLLPTEPLRTPRPELTLTLLGPSTPADQWANRLLDQAVPVIAEPLPSSTGIVWWQSSELTGQLTLEGDELQLGSQPLLLDELSRLSVLTPDRANANQLEVQGSIAWEGDALLLSVNGADAESTEADWLLSQGMPSLALKALVTEAATRDWVLTAAYTDLLADEGQLVLVSAVQPGAATPTPFATAPAQTPTPTGTPTQTPTLTPTRVPEAYMGQVLAGQLAPVIDATDSFRREAVEEYAEAHPWTGLLTWTETGAEIGGMPVAVEAAEELTFYMLRAGSSAPEAQVGARQFLTITYDGSVTRFPEQQILFQEQRMGEVLFWLVRAAAEEGGQLYVAYDDFGVRQAITVLDFRPYGGPRP